MKNINIGVANLIISNKLKHSYYKNVLIKECKQLTTDFFDVVRNSPILQLEFKVYNNLENKNIEDDLTATRYIDSNIKLFEVYTVNEIEKEHEKLVTFIDENSELDSEKLKLYESICNLIIESVNDYDLVDVDKIHESFTTVLNHIKSPKKQIVENRDYKLINEDVIAIAIEKFNEKYSNLNEDDKILFKQLINTNNTQKIEILETYKNDCLVILEKLDKTNVEDKIEKTIDKIKNMNYKPNSRFLKEQIEDDIISLHELKKSLL